MKFVLYPPGTPFQQEMIDFHGRFPLPASITKKVHICLHHVCACSCHVLPILNDVKGSPSMAKVPTPHMPWFCWVAKQCNRSCRLQVILGTDRFIRPRNLKGALYSRDAWTFSNQPWMILRVSRHSEHRNLAQRRLHPQGNLFELKSFTTILVAEENRWWLDHAASIVSFWKVIITPNVEKDQYVDGTSLGVHICQSIAGYHHATPSGTQIAGADTKSRPTASGATGWLIFGSQYRWLEGLAYRLTQHASTSPIPYPWSTHQLASICYDLTGFFLGMSSMKPSRLGSPCYRDS